MKQNPVVDMTIGIIMAVIGIIFLRNASTIANPQSEIYLLVVLAYGLTALFGIKLAFSNAEDATSILESYASGIYRLATRS